MPALTASPPERPFDPRRGERADPPTPKLGWSTPSDEPELRSDAVAMRSLLETIARAANAGVPVLIQGESGSGKEVMARAIHGQGPRRHCRFITIDCPALIDGFAPRERWGAPPATASPETQDLAGQGLMERLASAEGGTLFLDEVGDLPPTWQAKLLAFLQDHQASPADHERPRRRDIRIIAATSRELEDDVEAKRFRGDLLFRLNTLELRVPPLRERPEDILPLARRFLASLARAAGRPGITLSLEAESVLLAYSWPGNVRELRNAIERAIVLTRSPVLEPEAFPVRVTGAKHAGPRVGGPFTLEQLERAHITAILAQVRTMDEAATLLGIDASTLWRKRRRFEARGTLPR